MGKQFQVYLLPNDVMALVAELREQLGLRVIDPCSPDNVPSEGSVIKQGKEFVRIDALLAPESVPSSIALTYLPRRGCWTVDTLVSEVVEFEGCHFDEKTLKRGRFFVDTGFYEDGKWVKKSPAFIEWAESLFRIAKEILKKDDEVDAYVGEEAWRWRSRGGVFVSLAIKGRPPSINKKTVH